MNLCPPSARANSDSDGVRQTLSAQSLLPAANSAPSDEKPTDRTSWDAIKTTVGTNLTG